MSGQCGEKFYLGDAVYGLWSPWGRLTLTTEDGVRVSNTIHLEPEIIAVLQQRIEERVRHCAEENERYLRAVRDTEDTEDTEENGR